MREARGSGVGRRPWLALGLIAAAADPGAAERMSDPGTGPDATGAPAAVAAAPEPSPAARIAALAEAGRHGEAEALARELLAETERDHGAESLETADAIGSLLEALWSAGGAARPEALQLAERQLAIRTRALGPAHAHVAESLHAVASMHRAAGRYPDAVRHYERALEMRRAVLGADHLDVAESLHGLASVLRTMGDDVAARRNFELSLGIREKTLGPDHPDVAESLLGLARAQRALGESEAARPLVERALRIAQASWGPEHAAVADALASLAQLHADRGDLATARSLQEQALAIDRTTYGADHLGLARSLGGLALTLSAQGDVAAARPAYEEALAIRRTALGPDHPAVADGLNNLAMLLQRAGDHAGALPLHEQALAIRRKTLGPGHASVASSLNNLAALHHRRGNDTAARPLFEEALAIARAALGPSHPDVAGSLNNLANLHHRAGDLAAARPLYEEAIAILRTARGPGHPEVGLALGNLGTLVHDAGDPGAACPLHEESISILRSALGPRHPDVARALDDLARAVAALGARARALELSLEAEAIGREHARNTLRALSERQALAHAAARPGGLGVALSAIASGMDGPSRSRAWDAVIRSRAFVLDEVAGRHRTAADAARIARIAQAMASASQRLAHLTIRGPGSSPPDGYRKLVEDARAELELAERDLARESSSFREDRRRAAVGFDDVAAALQPGDAVVAFTRHGGAIVGPRTGAARPAPAYLAFVLRGGEREPDAVPLGPAGDVDALVERWRHAAGAAGAPAGASQRSGDALRRAVWDPVAARLGDARRVFIVPDGALHLVGFGALPAEGTGYLVEAERLLHHVSAERDLVADGSRSAPGEGLLTVGGATFDAPGLFASLAGPGAASGRASGGASHGPVARATPPVPVRSERSGCAGLADLRFTPLPATTRESEELATLWSGRGAESQSNLAVTALTSDAATESAFKRDAPGKRVVHVATHGFFLGAECALEAGSGPRDGGRTGAPPPVSSGENPLLLAGLALAGANHRDAAGPDEEDGMLTAQEVAALDLSGVEWAVLSACGTGLGDVRAGEGVLGLERAFKVAGAQTVIMSLWSVDDEATRQWMRELHRTRLERRLDTAQCVREASLAVLRDRRAKGLSDSPFWWGAFVASGDWR